eukprot:scaffold10050_cov142-Amphora_coffeaeformis.AAC.5
MNSVVPFSGSSNNGSQHAGNGATPQFSCLDRFGQIHSASSYILLYQFHSLLTLPTVSSLVSILVPIEHAL